MSNNAPVITIDGPSGSGKGTISRIVATALGWHFLDSGALYRLTGLAAMRQQVDWDDKEALGELAATLDVRFEEDKGASRYLLSGEDVSDLIRQEDCALAASRVAAVASVREALLLLQRQSQRFPGLVADGRDMGTVIFPAAMLKIFLVASAEERAKRRYKQLKGKGISVNLSTLLVDIESRDRRDTNRSASPLVRAADAVLLDSTAKGIDEVVDTVLTLWQNVSADVQNKNGATV